MDGIEWAQLDGYGQVSGTPFTGDLDGLQSFIGKGVSDVATFVRNDEAQVYFRGRNIRCTMFTMNLPWGRYRFIPAAATRLPPVRQRFHFGLRPGLG